jgi:hypothetical protein
MKKKVDDKLPKIDLMLNLMNNKLVCIIIQFIKVLRTLKFH